jgi:hypothetical protein
MYPGAIEYDFRRVGEDGVPLSEMYRSRVRLDWKAREEFSCRYLRLSNVRDLLNMSFEADWFRVGAARLVGAGLGSFRRSDVIGIFL